MSEANKRACPHAVNHADQADQASSPTCKVEVIGAKLVRGERRGRAKTDSIVVGVTHAVDLATIASPL